jgi:Ca2+-binding EF-hand superfamily protein
MRTALLPLAFLIAAAPAIAQDLSALPDRPIARTEVVAAIKKQFAAMDADHDGVVTRAEFERFRAHQPRATGIAALTYVSSTWFEHVDADGDGRVTYAEASARPLRLFDLADVNRDGTVSPGERQAAQALMALTGGR